MASRKLGRSAGSSAEYPVASPPPKAVLAYRPISIVTAGLFAAYFLGLDFAAALVLCGLCGVASITFSVASRRRTVSSSE